MNNLIGATQNVLSIMILMVMLLPATAVVSMDIQTRQGSVDRKPNIVLITMDDMRSDELRYMPNVKKWIADKGFNFTRAYSTLPQCCPARVSLLTGRYAHNHGVMSNSFRFGGGYQQYKLTVDPDDTLGVLMRDAGYRTSYIGKFLNGYAQNMGDAVQPGWDDWRVPVGRGIYSYDKQTFNMNGRVVTKARHNTATVTDLAIGDMRAGNRPFFVWVNYLAPHTGKQSGRFAHPQPLGREAGMLVEPRLIPIEKNLSDKASHIRGRGVLSPEDRLFVQQSHAARVQAIIGVDRKIGAMMRHLKSTGQLNDTVVIFHSDNGYMLGEHGMRSGKNMPYEPATGVPLVMSGPGILSGRSPAMVTLQDVAVTIMRLGGVKPGASSVDGVSLLRVIENPRSFRDRPVMYEAGPTLNNKTLGLRSRDGERFFTAIHYRRWVLIRYFDSQQELYDLRRDPDQQRSLDERPEYANVMAALRTELLRLRDCERSECNRRFELSK